MTNRKPDRQEYDEITTVRFLTSVGFLLLVLGVHTMTGLWPGGWLAGQFGERWFETGQTLTLSGALMCGCAIVAASILRHPERPASTAPDRAP
ncbi:MAG TPA: hypothetical protein VKE74_23545 [Gemmataceae bacterium]|nr:hypothetical protein [Gemmataceae bacterium]